jgi:CDP-paratose 2-epimerase
LKVLVSGGCGFIGSHACEFYARRGDAVVCYDSMTKYELARTGYGADAARDYNWKLLESLGVEMVKGDIRDYDELMRAADGCDFLVHTAAQPAMTISWEDPETDFSTNARGTFNMLKAARALGAPIVSCSSIHVYGPAINDDLVEGPTRYTREPAAIGEEHPVMRGTITPLHASKRAAELYVQCFADMYDVRAATFRLTGLYGPRQFGGEDHGWVANFCIRAVLGRPIRVFGTGKQLRDILFATDVVRAFHAFYERGESGVYTIGGGEANAISLLECIDLIGEIVGARPEVHFEEVRPGDLFYFICDSGKAERVMGWKSAVRPAEGVRTLIEWIRSEKGMFRSDA